MTAFDRYTVVILRTPEQPPQLDDAARAALQDAHMAHLSDLHDAGVLLAAGPLRDPDEHLRGLSFMNVPPERALELCRADPAVQAGVFDLVAFQWDVPAGLVAFRPGHLPRSVAEVLSGS